ncbi:MAG: hypothetical protein ACOYLQ_01625 [Hyphomicrobiaceae bacterium]
MFEKTHRLSGQADPSGFKNLAQNLASGQEFATGGFKGRPDGYGRRLVHPTWHVAQFA